MVSRVVLIFIILVNLCFAKVNNLEESMYLYNKTGKVPSLSKQQMIEAINSDHRENILKLIYNENLIEYKTHVKKIYEKTKSLYSLKTFLKLEQDDTARNLFIKHELKNKNIHPINEYSLLLARSQSKFDLDKNEFIKYLNHKSYEIRSLISSWYLNSTSADKLEATKINKILTSSPYQLRLRSYEKLIKIKLSKNQRTIIQNNCQKEVNKKVRKLCSNI